MASLRKKLKKIGRKSAKVLVKVNRGITVGAAAVGTYLGGPVVGAVATAAGAVNGQYLRATQARNEGKRGREARALGRGERKRVAMYGAAAMGVGLTAAVTAGALGVAGSGAAGNAAFGTAGSSALFGPQQALSAAGIAGNAPTQVMVPGVGQMTLPMNQAAAVAQSTGGKLLATQALAPAVAGAAGPGAAEILTATNTLFDAYKSANPGNSRNPGTIQSNAPVPPVPPGGGNSEESGGFWNGANPWGNVAPTGKDDNGMLILLGLGALLLLS